MTDSPLYLVVADPTQMTSSRPIPNNTWLTPHSTWRHLIQPKWQVIVPFLSLTLTLPGGIWSNPNDELSSHFYLWALTLPFGIWSLPNDELSSPFYLLHSLYLEASDPTQMTVIVPFQSLTLTLPGGIWSHPNDELPSHFYLWHSLYLVAADPTQMTSSRPVSSSITSSSTRSWPRSMPS